MTYNLLYRQTKKAFTQAGVDSPAFDTVCLLQHCFGIDRAGLILRGDNEAPIQETGRFSTLAARRIQGEPLQYILGKWSFMDADFFVGEGVLIPREDTAVTVLEAAEKLRGIPQAKVLDLCAGSGIIAISLAKQFADSRVYALELSDAAFPYLQKNIAYHKTANVTAVRDDVFKAFDSFTPAYFDLIVSNPPYIASDTINTLQREVRREPAMALDGGKDGFLFYKEIIRYWTPLLKHGGFIVFEIGEKQAGTVRSLLLQNGYTDVRFIKDIAQTDRCVSARRMP